MASTTVTLNSFSRIQPPNALAQKRQHFYGGFRRHFYSFYPRMVRNRIIPSKPYSYKANNNPMDPRFPTIRSK